MTIKRKIILGLTCVLITRIILLVYSATIGNNSFYLFDSFRYLNIGVNLFEHSYFAESIEEPVFESVFTTPLYPIVTYLINSIGGIFGIILFQIILQLFTLYIILKILFHLFNEKAEKMILPAAIIFALDIPSMVLGNFVMTETLFTTLIIVSFYFQLIFIKNNNIKWLIGSSTFMGFAALTRPIILYFPIFIILFLIVLYYNKIKYLLKILISYLLPFYTLTGIWFYCNFLMFGSFFYSYMSDFNFAYFRASSIYSEKYGISIIEARTKIYEEVNVLLSEKDPEEINQIEFNSALGIVARRVILAHPFLAFKMALKANINLYFRPVRDYLHIAMGSGEIFGKRTKDPGIFIHMMTYWQIAINIIMTILTIFGLYLMKSKIDLKIWISFILLFVYFSLVCSGPEIEGRFRVPLIPFMIILSVFSGFEIYQKFRSKKAPTS